MPARTSPVSMPLAPVLPMLWRQLRAELVRLWRTPSFLTSSLLLPTILFILFGLNKADHVEDGVSAQVYTLASFATYGMVSVMLYSFGVGLVNERAQRVNVLMRATPLPASVYVLAKLGTALLSALAMLLILGGFAATAGGVQLSAGAWATLIGSLLLGALPMVCLAFALGYLVNPTAATSIINLSFLVLSFASGVFVPLSQLPTALQDIAPYSPLYRLAQLAWNAVGVRTGAIGGTVWLLLLYGVAFLGLAIFAYRSEERRSFG